MSRSLICAYLLAGCFAPTPPEGGPCGSGDVCPSPLKCYAGVCTRHSDATPDAAIDAPADAATCPTGYTAIVGRTSMYRTVTTAQTWSAAEVDCENDGAGTHLAVVEDPAEDAAVDALTGASIWFGLTDRKVEGTPRWVTGAAPTYTNYGGASNTAAYDCAGIYQGKWAWGDCATLIKYVCECDGVAADPTAY